jgi:hypothetical protein
MIPVSHIMTRFEKPAEGMGCPKLVVSHVLDKGRIYRQLMCEQADRQGVKVKHPVLRKQRLEATIGQVKEEVPLCV